jgi:hypothetical protein
MRSLFHIIKRATKTTNHAIRNKIPGRWSHVDLLTKLSIKKGIFDIKLRNETSINRVCNKESVNSGHMNHKSKGLIIVKTMLLLKTTSNKTSLITLERAIGASLDLINRLAHDGTSMRRKRNKVPSASMLKSSDLLSHDMLPFWMKNGVMVCGRLKKNGASKAILVGKLQRPTITKIITRGWLSGRILN